MIDLSAERDSLRDQAAVPSSALLAPPSRNQHDTPQRHTFWRSWYHASQRARLPCVGLATDHILRVGAPTAAQPAWPGDYPRGAPGLAHGGAAAMRDHA